METPNFPEYQNENLPPLPEHRPRRRVLRTTIKIFILLLVLGISLFSYEVISSGSSPQEILVQLGRLITSRDRELTGEADGRVNILLLGIGGVGHDGPYLTDSMLIASIRPATNQVALISIPRDLLVEIPGHGQRRINNAYALPEINQPGSGGRVASTVVQNTFGIPIHYYLRLDFDGFSKLVDALGGITVDVEQTLDDEYYPIAGKEKAPEDERYEHLYIPAGRQHFDGVTALKYVRSRKAKGAQGSDFARSFRQQQVMAGIRDEATNLDVLRPGRIGELVRIINENLDTNLQLWEMLRLYELSKKFDQSNIVRHVLDDRPNGLLVATNIDGAYVLVPSAGNFSELQRLAAMPFDPIPLTSPLSESNWQVSTSSIAHRTGTTTLPAVTTPRLQIHNGTEISGMAARTEKFLRGKGYSIVSIGNAPIQTYLKTVVYNLRPPSNSDEFRELVEMLDAVPFESGTPAKIWQDGREVAYPIHANADILIIIGQNAAERIPE